MARHQHVPRSASAGPALALALGTAAMIVGTAVVSRRRRHQLERVDAYPDDAPQRARRALQGRAVVGNSVTINRPRRELYAFWRDFSNLPAFMQNVRGVAASPEGHTTWTIGADDRSSATLEAEITEERAGEMLAWRSLPDSEIAAEGRVRFRDAGPGRGTVVEATIAYTPPAGELGRLLAKVFRRDPETQGLRELRRLKMLMETGEIATSDNRKPR